MKEKQKKKGEEEEEEGGRKTNQRQLWGKAADIKSPIRRDKKSCLVEVIWGRRASLHGAKDHKEHERMSGRKKEKKKKEKRSWGKRRAKRQERQSDAATSVYLQRLWRSCIIIRDRVTSRGSQVLDLTCVPGARCSPGQDIKNIKTNLNIIGAAQPSKETTFFSKQHFVFPRGSNGNFYAHTLLTYTVSVVHVSPHEKFISLPVVLAPFLKHKTLCKTNMHQFFLFLSFTWRGGAVSGRRSTFVLR